MSAHELLNELQRCGVGVVADGDQLRLRAPAGVITADLRRRVLTCKPELIRLLGRASRLPSAPQGPAFHYADRLTGFGDICHGWTPAAWAVELRRKVERCQTYRPDIAEYYAAWAADIEARLSMSTTKTRKK